MVSEFNALRTEFRKQYPLLWECIDWDLVDFDTLDAVRRLLRRESRRRTMEAAVRAADRLMRASGHDPRVKVEVGSACRVYGGQSPVTHTYPVDQDRFNAAMRLLEGELSE